jgi:nucleotide-binding universal stress UspA family protein
MAIKNVLVPVDGSESALRALQHAAKHVRDPGSSCLLLLNVQGSLPASRRVPRTLIKEHYARVSEEALKPARELAERLGVDFQCYFREGDPAEVIASFARRTRCSEIVMGTRGLGRVSGLVLGSVAMKVIHLSSVPVTLVK